MSKTLYLTGSSSTFDPLGVDHPMWVTADAGVASNPGIGEEIRKNSSETWSFGSTDASALVYNERKWANALTSTYTLQINVTQTTSTLTVVSTNTPAGWRYYAEASTAVQIAGVVDVYPNFTTTGVKTSTWTTTTRWSQNPSGNEEGWNDPPVIRIEVINADTKNNGTINFGGSGGYGLTLPDPWGTQVADATVVTSGDQNTSSVATVAPLAGGVVLVMVTRDGNAAPTSVPSGWTLLDSIVWANNSKWSGVWAAHYDDSPSTGNITWGGTAYTCSTVVRVFNVPAGWLDYQQDFSDAVINADVYGLDVTLYSGSATTDHGVLVNYTAVDQDAAPVLYNAEYVTDVQAVRSTTGAQTTAFAWRPYSQNPTEPNDVVQWGGFSGSTRYYTHFSLVLSQDGVLVEHTAAATAADTHSTTATAGVVDTGDASSISDMGSIAAAATSPGMNVPAPITFLTAGPPVFMASSSQP